MGLLMMPIMAADESGPTASLLIKSDRSEWGRSHFVDHGEAFCWRSNASSVQNHR
jgi:hypothetical protein